MDNYAQRLSDQLLSKAEKFLFLVPVEEDKFIPERTYFKSIPQGTTLQTDPAPLAPEVRNFSLVEWEGADRLG